MARKSGYDAWLEQEEMARRAREEAARTLNNGSLSSEGTDADKDDKESKESKGKGEIAPAVVSADGSGTPSAAAAVPSVDATSLMNGGSGAVSAGVDPAPSVKSVGGPVEEARRRAEALASDPAGKWASPSAVAAAVPGASVNPLTEEEREAVLADRAALRDWNARSGLHAGNVLGDTKRQSGDKLSMMTDMLLGYGPEREKHAGDARYDRLTGMPLGEDGKPDFGSLGEYEPFARFLYQRMGAAQREAEELRLEQEEAERRERSRQAIAGVSDMMNSLTNMFFVGAGAGKGKVGALNQAQTYALPEVETRMEKERARRYSEREAMRKRLEQARQQFGQGLMYAGRTSESAKREAMKQAALNARNERNADIRDRSNDIREERQRFDWTKFKYQVKHDDEKDRQAWARISASIQNAAMRNGGRGLTPSAVKTLSESNVGGLAAMCESSVNDNVKKALKKLQNGDISAAAFITIIQANEPGIYEKWRDALLESTRVAGDGGGSGSGSGSGSGGGGGTGSGSGGGTGSGGGGGTGSGGGTGLKPLPGSSGKKALPGS